MKILWTSLILFCLAACAQDTSNLGERVVYWQHSLAKELPLGSTSDQVARWGKSHGITFSFLPEQHQFYASVERIPVNGIRLPCAEWNIIIQVTMGKAGRSTENKVEQLGNCL